MVETLDVLHVPVHLCDVRLCVLPRLRMPTGHRHDHPAGAVRVTDDSKRISDVEYDLADRAPALQHSVRLGRLCQRETRPDVHL